MIATILKSSSTFSAVEYNEKKVSKGVAELLEIKNFDYLTLSGNITPNALQEYLIKYSSINQRTKNTQFHLAISCKRDEYSYDELVKIAHQYLKEMGYEEEGQPLLIYAHHDTNNHHIHIVTSRIAPNGLKINDHNERLRSQKVLNKIMGIKPKQDVKQIIENSLTYSFNTIGQFQSILESCGYESYVEDNMLNIKKGGSVLDNIPLEKIEKHYSIKKKDDTKKRKLQLKAILLKYKKIALNKDELCRIMKKKFGVGLIFVGSKDKPYGYMVVDHKGKTVYKGSEILNMKVLLNFVEKQTNDASLHSDEILYFIHELLHDHRELTINDVNNLLWRKYGVNIYRNGTIRDMRYKTISQLNEEDFNILKENKKCKWLQSFCPTTEEEREILCRLGRIDNISRINIVSEKDKEKQNATILLIQGLMSVKDKKQVFEELRKNNIIILQKEENVFALNLRNSVIVNLNNEHIDISLLKKHDVKHEEEISTNASHQRQSIPFGQILRPAHSEHRANREWEVGSHDNWDDIDDERKLKR